MNGLTPHSHQDRGRPLHVADRTRKQGREKKLNKFDQSGLSMEELEKIQAEQFAAAAARHN